MKTILTLLIAATITVTTASANDYDYQSHKSAMTRTVDYCVPYVVCTQRVSSCREQRMGYDHCGRPFCYWVTVVTYRDVYSNGGSRTYTRTFSA